MTEQELRAAAHLGRKGAAQHFGVSTVTIWKYAKRYGIQMANSRVPSVLAKMSTTERDEYDFLKKYMSRQEALKALAREAGSA